MNGVVPLSQFAGERLQTDLQGLVNKFHSGRMDVYQTLDSFVGWAMALTDRSGAPVMPKTVRRFMDGAKKFLRYHGVEMRNDLFRERVTLPVVEEMPDIAGRTQACPNPTHVPDATLGGGCQLG